MRGDFRWGGEALVFAASHQKKHPPRVHRRRVRCWRFGRCRRICRRRVRRQRIRQRRVLRQRIRRRRVRRRRVRRWRFVVGEFVGCWKVFISKYNKNWKYFNFLVTLRLVRAESNPFLLIRESSLDKRKYFSLYVVGVYVTAVNSTLGF